MKVATRWMLALNAVSVWLSPFHWKVTLLLVTLFNATFFTFCQWHLVKPYVLFAYNCFFKPFLRLKTKGKAQQGHQSLLEGFYEDQAEIYDATRQCLLAGRETMLRLCAAQLKQVYLADELIPQDVQEAQHSDDEAKSDHCASPPPSPYLRPSLTATMRKKLVWVDIGGGTGSNVECMNQYIPIDQFHHVYVVDITPSLCNVATQRFSRLGWKNVTVVCQDALQFELSQYQQTLDDDIEIGLVTMSYSLSMFPSAYAIVDKIKGLLSPTGLLGVADFYVSSKHGSSLDPTRQHSWLTRLFWSTWFEADNVYLHHSRREYLEYRFSTVKQLNSRNWVLRHVIGMPYYVWIGAQPSCQSNDFQSLGSSLLDSVSNRLSGKSADWTLDDSSTERSGTLGGTPSILPMTKLDAKSSPAKEMSFGHVHGQGHQWRINYDPKPIPGLTTYIYAFAWEDPKVDLEYLDLQPDDHMLILTSGGCNALEYALNGPARIHCVDMNPCQGHLLELKIAAMTSLKYEDVWQLFGEGYHPNFAKLLDTHLSPYLSTHAYQFWKQNDKFRNFYLTGSSGLAIKAFKWMSKLKGLDNIVRKMCHSETLEEQERIWEAEVRPHFLDRRWIGLLNSYKFAWEALGVPKEQFEMLMSESSVYDYVVNTFDPLIRKELLSKTSYFYHLCLNQCYADNVQGNCPEWMTRDGHAKLTQTANLKSIRIHTQAIVDVLNSLPDEPTLTKVVVMDHMDWFTTELAAQEVEAFSRKMKQGGKILIRSSSKKPWYLNIFRQHGFKVQALGVRMSTRERQNDKWQTTLMELEQEHPEALVHECIDRVNMYASFWMAVKCD